MIFYRNVLRFSAHINLFLRRTNNKFDLENIDALWDILLKELETLLNYRVAESRLEPERSFCLRFVHTFYCYWRVVKWAALPSYVEKKSKRKRKGEKTELFFAPVAVVYALRVGLFLSFYSSRLLREKERVRGRE